MDDNSISKQLVGLQAKLLSFAYILTANKDEAKDLFQETALRALDNENKFTVDTNFKGWVFTLMRNIFINNYRKMVRQQQYVTPDEELYRLAMPFNTGYDSPEGLYTLHEITHVMDELEEDLRLPFSMFVSGYKYQEISETLNVPIGTVKSRIFAARKKMMKSLKDYQ